MLLHDYKTHQLLYKFDSVEGLKGEQYHDVIDDGSFIPKASGFGAFKSTGIFKKKRDIFVAVYVHNKNMIVSVGAETFNFSNGDFKAIRKVIFPVFLKKFAIYENNIERLKLVYSHVDSEVWPDDGDICTFIKKNANNKEDIECFVKHWEEIERGDFKLSREEIKTIRGPLRS